MSALEVDILRKFGIKVSKNQISEVIAFLSTDPWYSKQLQKIKASLGTMTNQDQFIQCIISSHKNISQIPENLRVIQNRENTFAIRAISPQNIKSLTERAFFNSFNLQRNVLNDLQQEIKLQKNTSYRPKQGKQRNCNDNNQSRNRTQNDQQQKCICGKNIPGSEWVQCSNEDKCRGSNWYHLECAGLDAKDIENVRDNNFNFTCELCKKEEMDEESGGSQLRKRNRDQESGK